MVSARGLWDRWCPPGSIDAIVRAYQRTVPCVVRVRGDEDPEAEGLDAEEVQEAIDRCLRYAPPRIGVPLLLESRSRRATAQLLERLGSRLREELSGCKLVLRDAEGSRHGLFPVIGLETSELTAGQKDALSPWGWRVPIETIVDPVLGHAVPAHLAEMKPARIVFDSVDLLTNLADARTWTPDREEEFWSRVLTVQPQVELWRASDLLEGEFLAYHARLPLS